MKQYSNNIRHTQAERARAYAAKVPPAVSGQAGHAVTFKLAVKLARGFDLGPDGAYPILADWNQLCEPPWKEAELLHKLNEADARGREPRGSMLEDYATIHPALVSPSPRTPAPADQVAKEKPDSTGFAGGTDAQIRELAATRPYHLEGLQLAQRRGLLVFGRWYGLECYGVTDESGSVLELRRVDGNLFPKTDKLNERKSHSVRHSRKTWPLGILESAAFPNIALMEGIPDFLTGHYVTLWEDCHDRVAVVAMLSGSPAIADNALPYFKGKHVRIFPHIDKTGIEGAAKWKAQLRAAGAAKVDVFDFSRHHKPNGEVIGDLYEFLHTPGHLLERFMPL